MGVQVTYPGVYIDEFAPAGPIEGVGTSTAAFIGAAASGELRTPVKITSFDQFAETFGDQPLPGFYLWYAVRGFFENSGKICYVVRASNGAHSALTLIDRTTAGNDVISVRARRPGVPSPPITVQVTANAQPVLTGTLYQPTSTFTVTAAREVTLPDANAAAQFRPGDIVDLGVSDPRTEIQRVGGVILRMTSNLAGALNSTGTIRLADATIETRTVRIGPPTSQGTFQPGILVPGTMLTIVQGASSATQLVDVVQAEPLALTSPATPLTTYRVTFRQGINVNLNLDPANPAQVRSEEFNIMVGQGASSRTYPNLAIDPAHPRYFASEVLTDGPNEPTGLVRVDPIERAIAVVPPDNLPKILTTPAALGGGTAEDLTILGDAEFVEALDTLRKIDDVNQIAIPDRTTATVQQAVIAHCEQMADRFGVLDAQPGLDLFGATSIDAQRLGLDSTRGFSALYYPWLRVARVGPGKPILVPPSGHVCGVYARSDNTRGVHKAPGNEFVNGAVGVERTMSNDEQGELNLKGINVIRVFQTGGRPVVWGARTTATDTNWQYVNVRRLFLFLEESISKNLARTAIFEPNTPGLWAKLHRSITDFLTRVWRDGALFGETAEKAFYVRIDEVLNPDSDRALGRLYIEIGVRPAYPAEFIIVRIGIWYGGSEVSEQ
jgi:phage tail sheath protein FI